MARKEFCDVLLLLPPSLLYSFPAILFTRMFANDKRFGLANMVLGVCRGIE